MKAGRKPKKPIKRRRPKHRGLKVILRKRRRKT